MASNISTSLIISTYNRSDALELCVKSVLRQSLLPDEIIIADDGSKEDTRDRKSTRLNSSHKHRSRMPSSA